MKEKKLATGITRLSDGRLRVRATCRHPETGARLSRQITLPEGTSLKDAETARLIEQGQLRQEALNPLAPVSTLSAYAEQWLLLKAARLKPRAVDTYITALGHILPELGHKIVNEITRTDAERWVVWAEAQQRADGEPYSQETISGWWRILKMLLRDIAADHDLSDPTNRVRAPKVSTKLKRELRTLSMDELARVLEATRVHVPSRYAEIATLAYTGMRAGEVYGLAWEDLDLDRDIIHVRHSASKGSLTETKTRVERQVYCPPALAKILKAHRLEMIAHQHPGLGTGMVFPSDTGTLRDASSLTKPMQLIAKTADIPHRIGAQVLRRTFNTLLVAAGADRIVLRAQMGHSSEAMTQRYAGIPIELKRQAVRKAFK